MKERERPRRRAAVTHVGAADAAGGARGPVTLAHAHAHTHARVLS